LARIPKRDTPAMNIMEIISGRRLNGAILHCFLLSRELARRGHAVTLVCLPDSWIGRRAAEEGIDVVPSDLHRWPPNELRRVAGIVRQKQIGVIHTHTSRSNFFGVLLRWLAGVPSVATAHSRHLQLHWMFNDRVIAVSEASRRYQRWHNFVQSRRIETVHNFIDTSRLTRISAEARHKVRAWMGVEETDLLLGTVGSLIRRKGLIHLVRAMPGILAAAPRARLAVVGSDTQGDYAIEARAAAKKLGVGSRIHWTGNRSDVPEILTALDLYVLPSLEESFPLSILEAMSAGLPVVATKVGGVPECVVDGQTGILVPPARSDRLAEAIVSLLDDPQRRHALGEAGRRRVLEHFSPQSQVAAIEAVFERVARQRAA
jgi:glycosyltransferase involved in cell wall biosynthesis